MTTMQGMLGLPVEALNTVNIPIEPAKPSDEPWIRALLRADGYRFQGDVAWYRWTHYAHGPTNHWDVIRPYAFYHWVERKKDRVKVGYELAVDRRIRRQGLGTRLLAHVGVPQEFKVDVDNDASNGMVQRFGFHKIGVVQTKTNSRGTHKTLNHYRMDSLPRVDAPRETAPDAADPIVSSEPDAPWRNRIVGYADMDPRTLDPHPHNPRQHSELQLAGLEGVLESLGVIQNVVWNKVTGHVIDGHARRLLAIDRNEPTVPVTVVELSEPEEALALATFDPIATLATFDRSQYANLLKIAETSNDQVRLLLDEIATREQVFNLSSGALAILRETGDTLGSPGVEDTAVAFKFGSVSGLVEKEVYDVFHERYGGAIAADITLSDVLRHWLTDNATSEQMTDD